MRWQSLILWMAGCMAAVCTAPAADIVVPLSPGPMQCRDKIKVALPIGPRDIIVCPFSVAPEGRRLMLVREGPHTVSIDRNGNGRRDEDEPRIRTSEGGEIQADVWIGGKGVPHVFTVEGAMAGPLIHLSPGTCLSGVYEGEPVCLYDRNINGVYGEDELDGLQAGGPNSPMMPMAPLMMLAGRWMRAEFDEKGPSLKLTPFEAPLARVRVRVASRNPPESGPDSGMVMLFHEGHGMAVNLSTAASAEIPMGRYRLGSARIYRDAGVDRQLGFAGTGDRDARLDVNAARELILGAEPRLRVDVLDAGGGEAELANPRVVCALGDAYSPRWLGVSFQESAACSIRVVRRFADGREEGIGTFVPG